MLQENNCQQAVLGLSESCFTREVDSFNHKVSCSWLKIYILNFVDFVLYELLHQHHPLDASLLDGFDNVKVNGFMITCFKVTLCTRAANNYVHPLPICRSFQRT